MRVFINPGHAPGIDPGACAADCTEAEIARDIGRIVNHYLQAAGLETVILQSDNLAGESPGYPNITETANAWPADIFVSIHLNAFTDEGASGTETLIYTAGGEAENLAKCVQTQLVDTLRLVDRGIKERPGLAVLRCTDMPAILIEVGFITNDYDRQTILDRLDETAAAIARGITDYETILYRLNKKTDV